MTTKMNVYKVSASVMGERSNERVGFAVREFNIAASSLIEATSAAQRKADEQNWVLFKVEYVFQTELAQ